MACQYMRAAIFIWLATFSLVAGSPQATAQTMEQAVRGACIASAPGTDSANCVRKRQEDLKRYEEKDAIYAPIREVGVVSFCKQISLGELKGYETVASKYTACIKEQQFYYDSLKNMSSKPSAHAWNSCNSHDRYALGYGAIYSCVQEFKKDEDAEKAVDGAIKSSPFKY